MKKLIALLLSLVMLFALTIPAFADGPDGPPSEDWYAELMQKAKDEVITSHGGVPGQINVMVNGQCVKFTDAVPQATGGRTMVPFGAVMDVLGGESDYDSDTKTVTCVIGETTLTLTIGSDEMTKTVAGEVSTVKMDCAPYAKGGRTYIPLRFISQALGYDVKWDSYYNTAVITDLDALAEQIDKDFTIYNKLIAQNAITEQAQKSVGSAKLDVTLFDTINGDKTGKASYSYDLTASKAGASGKVEYDFSDLWEIVKGYIPMPLDEAGAEDFAKSMELVESLMKAKAELRMDLEKGKLYFSMPELFEALGSYMAGSGVQLPKDSWLSMSLEEMDLDELTGLMEQTTSVGKLLCATAAGASVSGAYSILSYDNITQAAEVAAKLYGDAKFTRKGSANVLTITRDDLFALVEEVAGMEVDDETKAVISKYDLTLTVKDNGDVDVEFQSNLALASSSINLGDALQITAKSSTRGGKTQSTMECHIKNALKMTVTVQQTVTGTSTGPELTPPQDVLVLPIDGTLPNSTISSPDGP